MRSGARLGRAVARRPSSSRFPVSDLCTQRVGRTDHSVPRTLRFGVRVVGDLAPAERVRDMPAARKLPSCPAQNATEKRPGVNRAGISGASLVSGHATGVVADSAAATAVTDEQLVRRLAAGPDEAALSELYDRYQAAMYGIAMRITNDSALAQDAVQEAFVGVWRNA